MRETVTHSLTLMWLEFQKHWKKNTKETITKMCKFDRKQLPSAPRISIYTKKDKKAYIHLNIT